MFKIWLKSASLKESRMLSKMDDIAQFVAKIDDDYEHS